MFLKKLVEKASKKPQPGCCLETEHVLPRISFHYGLPPAANILAYDPLHSILALSTKHGQIKLLGKGNTQALLESDDEQPTKFLQFISAHGVLFNVTSEDKIEVWDMEKKMLSQVHKSSEKITSFAAMLPFLFIFVGDSTGNISVWKLNQESFHIEKMKYCITYSASHGIINKDAVASPVSHILPQPSAESKRIFLIYADGLMVLWAIQESKAMCTTGLLPHETKKVTCACWVCPFGSRVAVGYNTGDISLYYVHPNSKTGSGSLKCGDVCNAQIVLASKLNLGYKLEKIPIASLKWVYSDEKSNRLYVMGASDAIPMSLVQVILLSEESENQTNTLRLQLPEPCADLEIISFSNNELSKNKEGFLILLGKSGHIYAYDDHSIEKYLLQSQKKSPLAAPIETIIKLPYYSSSVTSAQFCTNHYKTVGSSIENYTLVAKNLPSLFPLESKHFTPSHFTGFSKIKNLYITGHTDGTIIFWDATCSFLTPLLSLTQPTEDGLSSNDVAVTAVYYCAELRILFTGDKSGMVRTYQFKPEPFAMDNAFFSFPGIAKKGSNHVIQTVKYIKVNGPILYLAKRIGSKHIAVGCENGHISLIDTEGSVLYHKQIETGLSADIISLQFECFNHHGLEKNILVAVTMDSSILALDADTGNTLCSSAVHPKKRSRALFMKILDSSNVGLTGDTVQKPKLLLLCSEKAAYVYSLSHVVHGEKKVCYKKNFHSSPCYWASVISISSRVGVMFLFACGKFEIRSLPELSLIKEATLRSLTHIPVQQNYLAGYYLCSSPDGEVIMTRGDQEISVASMLLHGESYRQLDSFSQIYDKNLIASEDGLAASSVHLKEKKKGIFGNVSAGSKTIYGSGNVSAPSEELSVIFSNSNFPALHEDSKVLEVDDSELDIDDIDLDEKPKRHNATALLDKQKLASKFHSFKGKLKQRTMRNEKPSAQEDPPCGKDEALDQIKRKYGYSSSNDSSLAKMVQSKLADNVKRLQGISVKTAEIQDDALTFSTMAKETLRAAEHKSRK